MLGLFEDRCRGTALGDASTSEDDCRGGDVAAERKVVRGEEDCQATLLQAAEQVQYIDPSRGIKHADDLVGDQHLDVEQQSARDQKSLELAPDG